MRVVIILLSVGVILLAASLAFGDPVTIVTDQEGRAYALSRWTIRDVTADAFSRADQYYAASHPKAYMTDEAIEDLASHARKLIDQWYPDIGDFLQDYLAHLSAHEFANEVAQKINISKSGHAFAPADKSPSFPLIPGKP